MLREYTEKLIRHENLSEIEIIEAMGIIMDGRATEIQTASFLTALKSKGETIDEIVGCARVMRDRSEKINPASDKCMDTCGTGGDGAGIFNVSTAAAIMAAAGGAVIAKHGNRAMSGKSGSADVLEAMGVNIALSPKETEACINKTGIGFMFAQLYHKSMKHAAPVRRELGFRTVFNILGPLTNPAGVNRQVLGVYAESLVEPMAQVLQRLGAKHALVMHGLDGLDEISLNAPTKVAELKNSEISIKHILPEELGFSACGTDALKGGNAAENAEIIKGIFLNMPGPARDMAVLNAAAALYVAGVADSIADGVALAFDILAKGKAYKKLEEFIEATNKKGELN